MACSEEPRRHPAVSGSHQSSLCGQSNVAHLQERHYNLINLRPKILRQLSCKGQNR